MRRIYRSLVKPMLLPVLGSCQLENCLCLEKNFVYKSALAKTTHMEATVFPGIVSFDSLCS